MKTRNYVILLLLIAALGAVCSLAFAEADNVNYKEAIITATLKKVEVRPAEIETITPASEDGKTPAVVKEITPAVYELKLDLPFTPYAEIVYLNGQDVTYSYRNNLALEGKEVLVLVHYRIKDLPGTAVKNETAKAKAYAGFVGEDWGTIKASAKYKQHYPVTKADALAEVATDKEGKVLATTKYAEADAAEAVPFYKSLCGAEEVKKLSVIQAEQAVK